MKALLIEHVKRIDRDDDGVPLPVTGTLEGSVAITGTPAVTISGTPVFTDADNPGRHAFQAPLCIAFGDSSCKSVPTAITVPSDSRAVIEFVSASCSIDMRGLGLQTTVGGVTVFHFFIPVSAVTPTSSGANMSQLTRIYADPGTQVRVDGGTKVLTGGGCDFSVSGYMLKP